MKISNQKYFLLLAASLLIVGCDPNITSDEEVVAIEPGSADFSTYVAIGDSITAGYADSTLYRQGQENSFPAILAQQFALVGGGAFTQPLMPMDATGSLTFGMTDLGRSDRLLLVPTGDPANPATPAPISPAISSDIATASIPGLYNNLGVPGSKVFHVPAPGYGSPAGLLAMPPLANPYFVRMANVQATSSMLSDALAQAPTFFTLWSGNNDLFLYASDGADSTVSGQAATPIATMKASFDAIIGALNNANNKGVVANIPDISTLPYFTRVPHNPVPLDQATADQVNAGYLDYNNGLLGAELASFITAEERARRTLTVAAGSSNPLLILDESLTDLTFIDPRLVNLRQATASDYIMLPSSSKIGNEAVPGDPTTVWGVGAPMLDGDVLTETEFANEIEPVRLAFNLHVKAAADAAPDLVFFDASAKFAEISANGASYGTGAVYSTFATGGLFSLDGVHPTARGYAVLANEIIRVINEGFGATIPLVDPGEYTTVFYQ